MDLFCANDLYIFKFVTVANELGLDYSHRENVQQRLSVGDVRYYRL